MCTVEFSLQPHLSLFFFCLLFSNICEPLYFLIFSWQNQTISMMLTKCDAINSFLWNAVAAITGQSLQVLNFWVSKTQDPASRCLKQGSAVLNLRLLQASLHAPLFSHWCYPNWGTFHVCMCVCICVRTCTCMQSCGQCPVFSSIVLCHVLVSFPRRSLWLQLANLARLESQQVKEFSFLCLHSTREYRNWLLHPDIFDIGAEDWTRVSCLQLKYSASWLISQSPLNF